MASNRPKKRRRKEVQHGVSPPTKSDDKAFYSSIAMREPPVVTISDEESDEIDDADDNAWDIDRMLQDTWGKGQRKGKERKCPSRPPTKSRPEDGPPLGRNVIEIPDDEDVVLVPNDEEVLLGGPMPNTAPGQLNDAKSQALGEMMRAARDKSEALRRRASEEAGPPSPDVEVEPCSAVHLVADAEESPPPSCSTIRIQIVGDDYDVPTKIRPNQQFRALLKCLSDDLHREVRLMFDGCEILPQQTPEDLDMEDGDQIDLKFCTQ